MQTRRFTQLPGLALRVLFTLLVGSVGADDRKDDRKLGSICGPSLHKAFGTA